MINVRPPFIYFFFFQQKHFICLSDFFFFINKTLKRYLKNFLNKTDLRKKIFLTQ